MSLGVNDFELLVGCHSVGAGRIGGRLVGVVVVKVGCAGTLKFAPRSRLDVAWSSGGGVTACSRRELWETRLGQIGRQKMLSRQRFDCGRLSESLALQDCSHSPQEYAYSHKPDSGAYGQHHAGSLPTTSQAKPAETSYYNVVFFRVSLLIIT